MYDPVRWLIRSVQDPEKSCCFILGLQVLSKAYTVISRCTRNLIEAGRSPKRRTDQGIIL
jgi:hypothetical protein